jgi:hypothetical protein
MKKLEWFPVLFNGIETNLEVTKCGKVKRIKVDWTKRKTKIGEINFNTLKKHPQGYNVIGMHIKGLKQKTVQIQQLIASAFLNYKWNGHNLVVNHKNLPKTNNDVNNLEVISHRQNLSIERTIKSKLPVGVSWCNTYKKYVSRIYKNNKIIHLGYFNTIQEASNEYKKALN